MQHLVLLSGPLAVGKSTLTSNLIESHGFMKIASSGYLKEAAARMSISIDRTALQEIGDRLDLETDYFWIVENVAKPSFDAMPAQDKWLVDSVRKKRQVDHFRSTFGDAVLHVHLTAPEDELQRRFEHRLSTSNHNEGFVTYDGAIAHANERAARKLLDIADLVLDVTTRDANSLAKSVIDRLGAK